MLQIDDKDIKTLEKQLKTFASRAYPFASKQTINKAAFTGQKIARTGVAKSMITRNAFTKQSIRVKPTRTRNVNRHAARLGSTADYMETQEFGGTVVKQGKQGVAIPTSYSAGQGENNRKRTRLPRKPNKMANIQLKRRKSRGSSRKQRNLIAIKDAAASGRKFVYLNLGRRKGIFRVVGGKRNTKIKMVHDLSNTSVYVPARPWLAPAVAKTRNTMPLIYRKALMDQLKRHNIFA